MASARAKLGAARRGLISGQKKTDLLSGILGTASTVATFAGVQAKRAKTAWGEYEAGYKELGGDPVDIDKGGWFSRTFKGPGEGQVEIGKGRKYKTYDMQQVRKAGAFLGSDASAILDDEARTKYLERTAPGVEKTRHHDPTKSYPASTQQMPIDPSTIDPGTGTGFTPTSISPKHERMFRVRSATPPTTEPQQQPVAFEQGSESKRFAQSMNQPINIPEFTTQMPIDTSTLDPGAGRMREYDEPIQESKFGGVDPNLRGKNLWSKFTEKIGGYGSQIKEGVEEGGDKIKKGLGDFFYKATPENWEGPVDPHPKSLITGKYYSGTPSYAKGGSFVTNGPQMIMVGDNPGGKEAVNIVPLSKAELGRGKDTKIRNVDGKPSHVNLYEAHLIDTYKDEGEKEVKRIGSGTVNPNTGLKEYQVEEVVAGAGAGGGFSSFMDSLSLGLTVGSSLLKGFGAMGNKGKVEAGKKAAEEMYQEQLSFLEEKKELTTDIAGTQYATGVTDVSTGTGTTVQDIEASGDVSRSQSNLVTSTIDEKIKTQTGDVLEKYKTDVQKLMDTKQFTEAEADLSYRAGATSAEESYQQTLTSLESVPTTFLEGALG